ncbi:DUF4160 domain-containing protein [Castellaniella caeni]|uniref:DUF4160 domain-containing protein n=1 Tax=Castellaniella caeni TaxID=266123 RepID=UPI000830CB08|nr:DUF4160 domain-containing protein [Castellaniella caeni]
MPTISMFDGILIQMFWDDHAPPHFHALYAGYEVLIDIRTMQVLQGEMPGRTLSLIQKWGRLHQAGLSENWKLCQSNQPLKKIRAFW